MSSIMRLFLFSANVRELLPLSLTLATLPSTSLVLDSRPVLYPWAMAPTINTTKLVATAIATFVSTDKFIKFSPFNYGGQLDDHSSLNFSLLSSLRIPAC